MSVLLALILLWGVQQPVSAELGTVDGIVLQYASGEPVPDAQVFLTTSSIAAAVGNTSSDSLGRFHFENVPPGQYAVGARRDGFLASGSQGRADAVVALTLSGKENRRDVSLVLIPTGTINGRITSSTGAVAGITVEAVEETYTRMGRRTLRSVKSVTTNDRGEYRVFGLGPGDYQIRVLNRIAGASGARGNPSTLRNPTQGYTYFPGSDSFDSAKAIHLKAGADIYGVDFQSKTVPNGVTVSGRIDVNIPLPTPGTAVTTGFFLVPHDSTIINYGTPAQISGAKFDPAGGEFQLPGVMSGTYDLHAFVRYSPEGTTTLIAQRGVTFNYTGHATIEVSSRDIRDVSVLIRTGVETKGRVTVNGEEPKGRVGNALVGWSSFDTLPFSLLTIGDGPTGLARVDRETGEFTLTNISSGIYRASYGTTLPADAYVASAQIAGKDVLGSEITIGNGSPGMLEIDVRIPGAIVQGIVIDSRRQPVRGAAVTLVPEESKRGIFFRYGSATTDENGRFVIRGIAPGDYSLFAKDYGTIFSWMSPSFLSRYEADGIAVKASLANPADVSLTLITENN